MASYPPINNNNNNNTHPLVTGTVLGCSNKLTTETPAAVY